MQIWRESGLEAIEREQLQIGGIGKSGAAYQRAPAKYAELRASPRYDEPVQQYARPRSSVAIAH